MNICQFWYQSCCVFLTWFLLHSSGRSPAQCYILECAAHLLEAQRCWCYGTLLFRTLLNALTWYPSDATTCSEAAMFHRSGRMDWEKHATWIRSPHTFSNMFILIFSTQIGTTRWAAYVVVISESSFILMCINRHIRYCGLDLCEWCMLIDHP